MKNISEAMKEFKTNEAKKSPTADKIDDFLMSGDEKGAVKFAQSFLDGKKIDKKVDVKNISDVKLMISRFETGIIPDLSKALSEAKINEAAISLAWSTKEKEFGDDFYLGSELGKEMSKTKTHQNLVQGLIIQALSAKEDKIKKDLKKNGDTAIRYKTDVEVVVEIDTDGETFLYEVIY